MTPVPIIQRKLSKVTKKCILHPKCNFIQFYSKGELDITRPRLTLDTFQDSTLFMGYRYTSAKVRVISSTEEVLS